MRTLGGPDFRAEVQFAEPRIFTNRREAADATYREIEAMRAGEQLSENSDQISVVSCQ